MEPQRVRGMDASISYLLSTVQKAVKPQRARGGGASISYLFPMV